MSPTSILTSRQEEPKRAQQSCYNLLPVFRETIVAVSYTLSIALKTGTFTRISSCPPRGGTSPASPESCVFVSQYVEIICPCSLFLRRNLWSFRLCTSTTFFDWTGRQQHLVFPHNILVVASVSLSRLSLPSSSFCCTLSFSLAMFRRASGLSLADKNI